MTTNEDPDVGGESACFAHLICPDCGVVVGESDHAQGCTYADPESNLDAMNAVKPRPDDDGR
jgi:hypothetical protein